MSDAGKIERFGNLTNQLPFAIGMPADEFIIALVRQIPAIARVRFLRYPVLPDLEKRLAAHASPIDFDTATREAVVHVESGRQVFQFSRGEVTADTLGRMLVGIGPDVALGISSHVDLVGGGSAHIAMMDLKCDVSALNEQSVIDLFQHRLGPQGGILLDSGNSYHYYGLQLLDQSAWRVFLGRCLLTPLVDARYIAHRLIEGFCILRISKARTKSKIPTVLEWW